MSLNAGTRLGPYEILSAAGAGGMGEVYKARDTRLDRTVAIKVLPDSPRRSRRIARAVRARSQNDRQPESSAHLHALRHGPSRRHRFSGDGIYRRRDARAAFAERTAAARSSVAIRHRDRGRAGQGAPQRDHASRPEAGQHHADEVRREAAGFWPGKAAARCGARNS